MALFAGLGEIRCHVVRIGSSLVVLEMAADARGCGQVVVIVDVAIGALPGWDGMHAGQGKASGGVIKSSPEP